MAAVIAVAILTSTSLALLAERIAYRPFRRSGGFAPLICAFGVSFFLQQTFCGMFGTAVRSYPDPQWQRAAFHFSGYTIPHLDVLVVGLALLFMLALYLIVQRTRMGTAMRAVAEDGEAAR
jgi:branched-chain amino acid transport system permease protein